MESDVQTRLGVGSELALEDWQIGTVGGLLGSIVFGILMAILTPNVLEVAIPSLYGLEGGFAGTVVHLLHGIIIGVSFTMLFMAIGWTNLGLPRSIALGVGYGLVIWISLAAILMPIWLDAVGFALAPAAPNIAIESIVGHIAYGAVVGITYELLG